MAGRKTDVGTGAWFELAFGRLYAELYAHRGETEARTLLSTLAPVLPARGPVLDLGCGAGRLLHLLRRRYPDAVGLDLSKALLTLARAHASGPLGAPAPSAGDPALTGVPAPSAGAAAPSAGPGRSEPPRLVRADMRSMPLAPGAFTAVLSLFTSFGYFADASEDRQVLEDGARRLRPGGLFVLDFLNATRVIEDLVPYSRQQIGGRDVESLRSYDPGSQVVRKVVRVHEDGVPTWEYEEQVRAYRPAQLDHLFECTGLEVWNRYGDYGGAPFEETSSARYVLVARKGHASHPSIRSQEGREDG